MAVNMRWTVALYKSGDPSRDYIENTFYLQNTLPSVIFPDVDWNTLAVDIADVFGETRPLPDGYNRLTVKGYDMADAEPREPKAVHTKDTSIFETSSASPREVALCLSFYADRNLPRQRGRLYIGPWSVTHERPSVDDVTNVMNLGAAIADLGGPDIDWQVYSQRDNEYRKVTDYWCDNEWDTVRSRGLKATTRSTAQTSE